METGLRFRGYAFTVFKFDNRVIADLKALGTDTVIWMAYQEEFTDSMKEHLQGAIYFKNGKTWTAVKALFPKDTEGIKSIHLESFTKTPLINYNYVTKKESRVKNGEHFLWGEPPKGQGKRMDLLIVHETIRLNPMMRESQLWDMFPIQMTQYYTAFLRRKNLLIGPLLEMPITTVLSGITGAGKSHRAYHEAIAYLPEGEEIFYLMTPSSLKNKCWFDGYENHSAVIIEEMGPDCISQTLLKRILDKWPTRVEIKGNSVRWRPSRIWITSNYHPSAWYPGTVWEDSPLQRRLTTGGSQIIRMNTKYLPQPSD